MSFRVCTILFRIIHFTVNKERRLNLPLCLFFFSRHQPKKADLFFVLKNCILRFNAAKWPKKVWGQNFGSKNVIRLFQTVGEKPTGLQ